MPDPQAAHDTIRTWAVEIVIGVISALGGGAWMHRRAKSREGSTWKLEADVRDLKREFARHIEEATPLMKVVRRQEALESLGEDRHEAIREELAQIRAEHTQLAREVRDLHDRSIETHTMVRDLWERRVVPRA